MNEEFGELFEWLEPPTGGLARLRARMERPPRRPALQLAAACLMLLALALVLVLSPSAGPDRRAPDFGFVRLRLGIEPKPAEPLTVPDDMRELSAVSRVPLDDERVLFYLVGSLDQEEVRKQAL
jgi:hypothetical protein